MTTPDSPSTPERPPYDERVYRSSSALAGGVLTLALAAWLGGDAIIRGEGRTPWVSAGALLIAVPLVVAFSLRPAVFAGAEGLRVRNPFRTITAPWGTVEDLRAKWSSEVVAGGRTYQLWAIPVSLRARQRAVRRSARGYAGPDPQRSPADQALAELRELAGRTVAGGTGRGAPTVRWAYEIIAPAAAGAVLLGILAAV
jgi:hypothetical protein